MENEDTSYRNVTHLRETDTAFIVVLAAPSAAFEHGLYPEVAAVRVGIGVGFAICPNRRSTAACTYSSGALEERKVVESRGMEWSGEE